MTLNRTAVAQLYRLDPRTESGTLRRLDDVTTNPPAFSDFPLSFLGRRRPRVSQALGDVLVDQEETVFVVWASELGDVVPKQGDRIEDATGIEWAIREVQHKLENTRFDCHCIRLFNE